MPLETGTYISDLVPSNPALGDPLGQGDDHIRLVKSVLKATFPNLNAAVTALPADLNAMAANLTNLSNTINAEVTNRNNAVLTEIANRTAADNSEAFTRSFQDSALQTDYIYRDSLLTTDYTARDASVQSGLQSQINTINGQLPLFIPFSGLTYTLGGNGVYVHVPANSNAGVGFLIQCGSATLATGNGDGVPFPVPFPNATNGVVVSCAVPGPVFVAGTLPGGAAPSSGFVGYAHNTAGSTIPGVAINYIAIGF